MAGGAAGAERGDDAEAESVMDALRIAEIRECARNGDVDVGTLETIALCDLAERGLAGVVIPADDVPLAINIFSYLFQKQEFNLSEVDVTFCRKFLQLLSNPKHERRG